jgi:hypothetical protein
MIMRNRLPIWIGKFLALHCSVTAESIVYSRISFTLLRSICIIDHRFHVFVAFSVVCRVSVRVHLLKQSLG